MTDAAPDFVHNDQGVLVCRGCARTEEQLDQQGHVGGPCAGARFSVRDGNLRRCEGCQRTRGEVARDGHARGVCPVADALGAASPRGRGVRVVSAWPGLQEAVRASQDLRQNLLRAMRQALRQELTDRRKRAHPGVQMAESRLDTFEELMKVFTAIEKQLMLADTLSMRVWQDTMSVEKSTFVRYEPPSPGGSRDSGRTKPVSARRRGVVRGVRSQDAGRLPLPEPRRAGSAGGTGDDSAPDGRSGS